MINRYSILKDAKYLIKDGSQNYFLFQPVLRYFQVSRTNVNTKAMVWKPKGLSDEIIKPLLRQIKASAQNWNETCLTIKRVFTTNKIIEFCIVIEIKSWPYYFENSFTLRNSLFGGAKLTKIADPDKYSFLDMIFHLMNLERFYYQIEVLVRT